MFFSVFKPACKQFTKISCVLLGTSFFISSVVHSEPTSKGSSEPASEPTSESSSESAVKETNTQNPSSTVEGSKSKDTTDVPSDKDAKVLNGEDDSTEDTVEPPTTEELLQQVDWSRFDLPIPINESVIYWVDHFSNSGRWSASRWIRASGKYRNLIRAELKRANLPQDLLYMAMIESGFDPTATSHAQAVGVWQFIPSTGNTYGLIINEVIDERRDPIRSTQAAIGYLSKLNREFGGNWHLAMASYNAGEKRIYKAVAEKGTINYWELREALAEETQFYVPKILALAILDKYPELFGIPKTSKKEKPLILKQVSAKKNQHVSTLADMAEMDVEQFLQYNPHILKERLIVEESDIRIYVPPEKAETYIKNSRSNQQDRLSSGRGLTEAELAVLGGGTQTPTDVSHHQKSFEHTVVNGDTWSSLATQYGLRLSDLQRWNPELKSPEPAIGTLIRLSKPKAKKYVQYTVKKSDSLKSLAKKFNCSVTEIQTWNGLTEESSIESGDVLWMRE